MLPLTLPLLVPAAAFAAVPALTSAVLAVASAGTELGCIHHLQVCYAVSFL